MLSHQHLPTSTEPESAPACTLRGGRSFQRQSAPVPAAARQRWPFVRAWYLFVAVDVIAALIIQLALILSGGPDPNTGETVATVGVPRRLIQTISFFTIQSNILLLVVAVGIIVEPVRTALFWRVLRLDALLGITITGLVFDTVLISYVHPTGWQLVATIGLHYVAPWSTVLGWVWLGPSVDLSRRTVAWAMCWPAVWIAYTFAHGAITGWYPYSFVNAHRVGYPVAIRNVLIVVVLSAVLVGLFRYIERRRRGRQSNLYGRAQS